ncbi:MAG: hypothetical protein HFJ55_06395 [Clostridia bacterium]|jgi:hypothetical protein|nr:hypothetical protein [Clostridia bacterium]
MLEFVERTDGKEKEITTIALVVTLIVLLILAGTSIAMLTGENGIIKRATQAKENSRKAEVREKLELILLNAYNEKMLNDKYNQNEFLDNMITRGIEGAEVKGDIAIADGYAYEIDRSVPKIGKYLGKEKDLVFPEIVTSVTLAEDNKTATIHITAKEERNGISKIEIIQYGHVLETYEYENIKEEITENFITKQNGVYTIKVYTGITISERVKVEGIIASIEYSPNGSEEYKKEHRVKVSVKETDEKVKSIKYQWLDTTVEPSKESFLENCENNGTVIGKGVTGTYYLWILLETENGKTNICRSEGFNFDNQGPIVQLTSTPTSETSFTLNASANDKHSGIERYEFYVEGETIDTQVTQISSVQAVWAGTEMAEEKECYVRVYDVAGNQTTILVSARTKLYVWEISVLQQPAYYSIEVGKVNGGVTLTFPSKRREKANFENFNHKSRNR